MNNKTIEKVKKTLYIEQNLERKLKIQAVLENKTETDMINEILRSHFTELGEMKLK